jgi:methyl-accepting chemotaxis protein
MGMSQINQYLNIMAQATDTDISNLKTLIETIAQATEANTLAISNLSASFDVITKATEANTKAIADLTASMTGLREEIRVGFANVETRFTKLDGKIENIDTKLTGKIDTLEAKFDERTKGFGQRLDGKELAQRNIFTGLTVTIVGGLLLTLAKFLFFGSTP